MKTEGAETELPIYIRGNCMNRVIMESQMNYSIGETRVSCFQIIKSVLDELYQQIPFEDKLKDRVIQRKLELLREKYNDLKNGVIPKYNDPYLHFAYLYCYVASHANTLCQIIDNLPELSSAFDRDRINVSCVGGGPGSDLLGLLKFIQLRNKPAHLRCGTYDREETWYDSLRNICNRIDPLSPISPYFRIMDVTKPETWLEQAELCGADLFTLSFFMSEIPVIRNEANPFFRHLFKSAKSGSLFLFVDNSSGSAHLWFDALVKEHNKCSTYGHLEFLKKPEDKRVFVIESGEQKRYLEPYYSKFGDPKLRSYTYYRICRKVEEW